MCEDADQEADKVAEKGPQEDYKVTVGGALMQLLPNLDEEQSRQEHLDAYFADGFAIARIEKTESCRYGAVGDDQQDRQGCLNRRNEGSEKAIEYHCNAKGL